MRTQLAGVAGATVLASALLPLATTTSAAAAPTSVTPTATSTATSVPATGHFHALSTKRIVSTTAGVGIAKHRLAAGYANPVQIAGRGGLPTTGIRAVSISVTALKPGGATQLWLGPGSTKPAVPIVATSGPTSTSYAVLPLSSTGKLRVWVGAHATDLTIDVTGWYASGSQSGTAGLFKRLAGQTLASPTISAGGTKTVTVLGKRGVPTSGVSALLLHVTTSSRGAGQLGLAGSSTAAKASTALSYVNAAGTDLAMVKPSASAVVLSNRGSYAVTATLDVVGWFTNGADATAFGDALRTATPHGIFAGNTIGTGGATRLVAGAGGIAATSSTSPPSFVLVREYVGAVSASSLLRTEAAGATPTGLSYLRARKSLPAARTVLAAPGSAGQARWSTTAGTLKLTAQTYGWFAGAIAISDNAVPMTSSSISAISDTTDTGLSFTGVPAQLSSVQVGDVLVAGKTATTPIGLLRKVTSVDTSSGNLVLGTDQAALSDVIDQGSLSLGTAGAAPKAPAVPTAFPAAASTSRLAGTHDNRSSALATADGVSFGCTHSGSIFSAGISGSCTLSQSAADYDADVSVGVGAGADMEVDFSSGLLPHVAMTAFGDINAGAGVSGKATGSVSLVESGGTGIGLGYVVLPIGDIPVVLLPYLEPVLELTGNIAATFQARGQIGARLNARYDTITGFSDTVTPDPGSGSGSFAGVDSVGVTGSAGVAIKVYVDASPGLPWEPSFGVSATDNLSLSTDGCVLRVKAGVSLDVFAGIKVFGHGVSVSSSIANADKELFGVNIRDCAIWYATFNYHATDNWAGDVAKRSLTSSSSMSTPLLSHPPEENTYELSGSSTGDQLQQQQGTCGWENSVFWATRDTTWSGDVASVYGGKLGITILPAGTGQYVATLYGTPSVPNAHITGDGWTTNPLTGDCEATHDESDYANWTQDVFALFQTSGGAGGQVYFDLGPGPGSVSGDETIPGDNSTDTTGYTLHWTFTKTCSKGGSDC